MEEKNKQEQQMMNDEYGRDFGGCIWGLLACLVGIAVLGCVILFT